MTAGAIASLNNTRSTGRIEYRSVLVLCESYRVAAWKLRVDSSVSGELSKVLAVEGGAAHEATVDVRLAHDLGDGVGLHRAAVEDADSVSDLVAGELAHELANSSAHFLCIVRRRNLAGADSPDRLIGNDGLLQILGRQALEGETGLVDDIVDVSTRLTDGKRLAYADDGRMPCLIAAAAFSETSLSVSPWYSRRSE